MAAPLVAFDGGEMNRKIWVNSSVRNKKAIRRESRFFPPQTTSGIPNGIHASLWRTSFLPSVMSSFLSFAFYFLPRFVFCFFHDCHYCFLFCFVFYLVQIHRERWVWYQLQYRYHYGIRCHWFGHWSIHMCHIRKHAQLHTMTHQGTQSTIMWLNAQHL